MFADDRTACFTKFPVLQRRLKLYLIALWGGALQTEISPAAKSNVWSGPYLENGAIRLPPAWATQIDGMHLSRAAAAHAAAHLVYGRPFPTIADLRPRQRALIGLIEDARVEYLAARHFPGLQRLWLSCLLRDGPAVQDFTGLTHRLARALLDPGYHDENAWVRKAVTLFQTQREHADDPRIGYEIGLRLAHDLGQMRIAMDEGKPFTVAAYRDDNRHLGIDPRTLSSLAASQETDDMPVEIGSVFLREADTGRELELADHGDGNRPPGAYYVTESPDQPILEYRRRPNAETPGVLLYPEWNYRTRIMRQRWCTVREKPPHRGDASLAEQRLSAYRALLHRLIRLARELRLERLQRLRRQKSGDEIDLDAAILALVDAQAGFSPDDRIHLCTRSLHDRGLATLLLLDLSASTDTPIAAGGQTILELARDATLLLAHTMNALGETFAIHGFSSRGRHDVAYYGLKEFEAPFDALAQAQIAGVHGHDSTRLGTALRHAVSRLIDQTEQRKLLLVVTDGEPSDIDAYDPDYLLHDAREAVREARRKGVTVFCLSLDPNADRYVARIFGAAHYAVLDHLARLPERLARLFLTVIRHY